MTSNQLTLGRLREDIRHNKATEGIGYATLGETKRHNVQSEAIGFGNIGLGYSQLGEAKRHNIANESYQYGQLHESNRHNVATEEYQSQQALANAGKANADAAYTELQIEHYLEDLKIKAANAEAALRNAASNEQRAEIEKQLAEIKSSVAYWEKQRLKTQMFHDVASGVGDLAGAAGDVAGIFKPGKW